MTGPIIPKPNAVLDRFRLKRIDLKAKSLWIDVMVFADRKDVEGHRPNSERHKGTQGCFVVMMPSQGCIGQIRLAPMRSMEALIVHECIHAAFWVSRYRRLWPVEEDEREEFIAHTADYMFKEITKRLRSKGILR